MSTVVATIELNAVATLPDGVTLAGYRVTATDHSGAAQTQDVQAGTPATFSITVPGDGTMDAQTLGSDGNLYGPTASAPFTVPGGTSVAAPSAVTVQVS